MVGRVRHLLAGFTTRELILVFAALAVGTAIVLFIGVVEPLAASRRESAARLVDRIELLEWTTARAAEARALRDSLHDRGAAGGAVSIAEIEAGFNALGLRPALTRLEPRPGGRFDARFEDVSYTALIGWLAELGRRSSIAVTAIVIEATGRPDRVDAALSAVVRRGEPP